MNLDPPGLESPSVEEGEDVNQTGNGHIPPAEVNKALDCLTKKTNCGSYTTHGTWPALRGLMT